MAMEQVEARDPYLEDLSEEDQAKLKWLRAAAKEGFDALDRGEGIQYTSMDELVADIEQMAREVEAEHTLENPRG